MIRDMKWWLGLALVVLAGCAGSSSTPGMDGRVRLAVTEKGFEPKELRVPAGKAVTLVVTRRTDRTCATELVLADYGIKRELPLGKTVEVTFTPQKPGKLRYACGMDMIAGTLWVE